VISQAQTKKQIGTAYMEAGQDDKAISTFQDILEDLSQSGVGEGKSVKLLQAEIWNCLARVYRKKDDLPQAKNFAKLGKCLLVPFVCL
jgi:tetratricopeptide (TPR) repeat protein